MGWSLSGTLFGRVNPESGGGERSKARVRKALEMGPG